MTFRGYSAQSAAFVPPSGGNSCAAAAALSYAQWADFITGLPVYSLSEATGFRCISSGTSLSACIDILPFIGICIALKLNFYLPKAHNEISERYIGSTAADAAVTSRRVRGSMKSTLRVDEIPACAGMKCSRVAPARNTRALLGYVSGLYEPRNRTQYILYACQMPRHVVKVSPQPTMAALTLRGLVV